MSMNQIMIQGLNLMEEAVSLPFKWVQDQLPNNEESSSSSKIIRQSAGITQGLVTIPIKMARDFLGANDQQHN